MVRNSKSALFALAAAGGLWAWRNRDKVQGWLNTARNQINTNRSFTGETRRIGDNTYSNPSDIPSHSDRYTTDI
jgi:hypothetical protein